MSDLHPTRWPRTLREVAEFSDSIEDFGRYLREWEHSISRKGVHSRPALRRSLEEEPPQMRGRFDQGDVADAYLAALAEWLVRKHDLEDLEWTVDPPRIADRAWWAHGARAELLASTPASFRTRHLFTMPNDPFRPRAGRPRVSEEQKRRKLAERQKRYRARVNALLKQARAEMRFSSKECESS